MYRCHGIVAIGRDRVIIVTAAIVLKHFSLKSSSKKEVHRLCSANYMLMEYLVKYSIGQTLFPDINALVFLLSTLSASLNFSRLLRSLKLNRGERRLLSSLSHLRDHQTNLHLFHRSTSFT